MKAEDEFTVTNAKGLHARAAAKVAEVANRFPCKVELEKDGQRVNASSIMGLLLLCGQMGSKVKVYAEGERADEALSALEMLFQEGFGEHT